MRSEAQPNDEASILLVDDDLEVLSVLQRALAAAGLRVSVASSGATALKLLAEQRFDAVVSDIQMPEMNGLKLLYAVREYDLDLPVVLMTGHPEVKTATSAVAYGAFQYLIKPVAVDRLRAVIERAVDTGRIARLKREYAQEFGSGSFYVGDRAGIESKLNRALQSLWMAYQPIIRAADGSLFGYEALLRSEEPMLPNPGALLKAAEKLRRVHDIGRAVRERVALDLEQVTAHAFLFVNLHVEDLMDPALYFPTAPLTRVASRVILELSDRGSVADVAEASARLERLRELGFRIAIDDLGAGQSDPNTFAQLEPEFVKLDISVVRGVDRDGGKNKVVRSIVRLCHKLGKAVIAEGIETEGERSALIDAECDFLQGYFLGVAAPLGKQRLKAQLA